MIHMKQHVMERKLSPFEQAIWRLSDAATFNFSVVGQLQGSLNDDALNESLHLVQLRHPMLRVRVDTEGRDPWFSTESVPRLRARIIEHDQRDWCSHVEDELNDPLLWNPGPLMRCRCIRRDEASHEIVLTFHHLVGDGTSGILLMRDLMAAINHIASGKPESTWKRLTDTVPIDCRLPHRFRGLRGILSQCQQVIRSVTEDIRFGSPTVLPEHPVAASTRRRLIVIPHSFSEKFSTTLRKRAKLAAASLHGAISAAIILSTVEEIAARKAVSIKHRMPVNMRAQLVPPVGEESGMFASMLVARVRCMGSDDFWQVAGEIAKQVSSSLQTGQAATNVRMVPTLFQLIRGRRLTNDQLVSRWQKVLRSATALTNLGDVRIDWPAGPVQITELQFIASPGPLGDHTCAAMSHRGRLQCNFTFALPAFSGEVAQRMTASVTNRLKHAVAEVKEPGHLKTQEPAVRAA